MCLCQGWSFALLLLGSGGHTGPWQEGILVHNRHTQKLTGSLLACYVCTHNLTTVCLNNSAPCEPCTGGLCPALGLGTFPLPKIHDYHDDLALPGRVERLLTLVHRSLSTCMFFSSMLGDAEGLFIVRQVPACTETADE